MEDFFAEQFEVNDSPEAFARWQVYDRTEDREVPAASGIMRKKAEPWF